MCQNLNPGRKEFWEGLLIEVVITRKESAKYNILQENDHAPATIDELLIIHKITNIRENIRPSPLN